MSRTALHDITRGTRSEGWMVPVTVIDFKGGEGRLVDKVREKGAVPKGCLLGVHASPECLTQSIIMAPEAANGRGTGPNAKKETCPEADKAIWQIVYGIIAYLESEPRDNKVDITLRWPHVAVISLCSLVLDKTAPRGGPLYIPHHRQVPILALI